MTSRKPLREVRDELKAALGNGPQGTGEMAESLRRFLASFPAGWDGATARPIRSDVIESVCRFFDRLAEHGCGELFIMPGTETDCFIPHCVPLVSGGVQLEWHVADRILELEFESADAIRYLKWWPGHDVADEERSYPADDIEQSADLIRWVFTGDDPAAL